MLKFIWQLLRWLRGGALQLLLIAIVILIIWGITSPVGTLVWWLGQEAANLGFMKSPVESLMPQKNSFSLFQNPQQANHSALTCYIIFLPGVGDFSADELTPGEEFFLQHLVEQHPNCVTIGDIFPYSAANKSLGGQRFFAPVWRWVNRATGWWEIAGIAIQIRNLWRFAISVDYRYGQVYNQGIATAIIERMNAKRPLLASDTQKLQIILMGTSGGVQVALGAAPYLQNWLNAKISIVSIGGVFSGRNGFQSIERFYHLRGDRDLIEDIGGIIFPSRWQWFLTSPYNQARQQGRYQASISGPHEHDGPQGYFGEELAGEGETFVDLTLQQVNRIPIWPEDKPD